ncbi:MAG: PTS sugar transporter [Desulfuromonas sp.]|uniref:PTS sugar transporter subunit IIA n=1 Tax=Desulfuromonas sp. TaxID=892 RepID=UPI000CB3B49E|nr:PTS system fructose subfamily IIA component [Desulfuromonas sp.]PLX86022.1 MAG: PTS sugar transporter [Desulfuromonas sp.]
MVGLVIATHSRLAEELIAASEMIIGPAQNARSVCITREDSVESIRLGISRAIEEVTEGREGVVIMTDMFGGTPANISLSFLEPQRVEVLTGVNLPMVLKFFNSQEGLSLGELASMLKAYGQQSISLASEILAK